MNEYVGYADLTYGLKAKKKSWKPVQWLCFGIALIPLVSFVIFNGVPVIISFISMFTEMDNNDLSTMRWNGFANFVNVFHDERFWKSWGTTLWLATARYPEFNKEICQFFSGDILYSLYLFVRRGRHYVEMDIFNGSGRVERDIRRQYRVAQQLRSFYTVGLVHLYYDCMAGTGIRYSNVQGGA